MEDRFLSRGKRVDTGEWVEGYLSYPFCTKKGNESYYFYAKDSLGFFCRCVVDASTICQCTGLKDKNGKLIWENDIVKFEDCGEEGYEYKEGFDFENKARVEFTEGRWSLTDFLSDNSAVIDGMYDHEEFMDLWGECEVIGNMIDNPELLEVWE